MKKLPVFLILCLAISSFFSSCEKEPLPELSEESVHQAIIIMADSGEEDVPIDDKKE